MQVILINYFQRDIVKRIILFLCVLSLSGCASLPAQEPLKQTVKFNEAEAKKMLAVGNNTVYGSAFLKQMGGGVVTCAGETVRLIPATMYATERMKYFYGPSVDYSVGVYFGGKSAEDNAPYESNIKTTVCNQNGDFSFDNVADGSFYVSTVVLWKVAHRIQGGGLAQRVNVKSGEKKQVILTSK